ncbi:serine/threonine-protein kinase [Streptomyces aurantiogriseus]|uniref:Serine/threonine protein kinase n=1 Tax=Streptomyces aurantiogriseus TaxID=66870 RepID=A0A918FPB4_9ACTN|nr:serine/threonine-protein kinase [Streptomyces aurantiogriseus]GGR57244.1 serine/threonine protein kinase [Streptomyces aurantiogriseus]
MTPQRNTGAGAEAELPEYAGHYHLESCLGSGGMGVVHLARSTSGMKLAVKVVHAEFARDPEFRGRFRQEIAAARRVSGAFTAPVVDADPEAERPWMATLFIPGPTLSEHVKRNGPMGAGELRRLMAGLAEALRDIHRVGVVHRDLKPSNVLLAEDGPKVIDFGISRPKDSELRTETGKLIGTPPFMAPEQFRRPREVGPAADIFALGSVLVHAATGRGPFDSDSPYVVAYQVVHDEPDLTGVPENLAPLVLRCLAKEPEERPTPDELMRELRSVAASYDTQAFIPTQRSMDAPQPDAPKPPQEQDAEAARASGPRRSRRGRVALAVGALVLVVGAGLVSARLLGGGDADSTGRNTGASRSAADAFTPWATRPATGGAGGMPQCAYDAKRLICAQSELVSALDASDGRVVWRHALSAGDKPGEAPVLAGGLAHVLTHSGKRVEALDPSSGKTRWQREVSAYPGIRYVGGTLLLTAADGTVTGVDAASGRTRWSRRMPGAGQPYFVSFPGDPLAYVTTTSGDGRTRITAVDPATGDVRWDERFNGELTPVGTARDSLVLLSGSGEYGKADAVVRFYPETKVSRRVALSVALQQASAAVHGDRVYLLTFDGSLVAVDTLAGKRLWSLQTAVSRGSVPTADGEHVYFSAPDGRLLAVDADAGKLIGQTALRLGADSDKVVTALPAPGAVGGRVYAGAPDGTVFAVDGSDPSGW